MHLQAFSSPVLITIEAADGRRHLYPIRDLAKAAAVIRWYGIRQVTDFRARNPGIWLIAAKALACAHDHPEPTTIEHARKMFEALARKSGILADMSSLRREPSAYH